MKYEARARDLLATVVCKMLHMRRRHVLLSMVWSRHNMTSQRAVELSCSGKKRFPVN